MEQIDVILRHLDEEEGDIVIAKSSKPSEWLVKVTFGKEAEDSPMAGGAAYGVAETLEVALAEVLDQTGWK